MANQNILKIIDDNKGVSAEENEKLIQLNESSLLFKKYFSKILFAFSGA